MSAAQTPGRTAPGYTSGRYAASFRHEGEPRRLEASGSWLIRRPVPTTPATFDATACYPFLSCRNWGALASDLSDLEAEGLITMTAVMDPLGDHDETDLRRAFPELLRPYKRHQILEIDGYDAMSPSAHHRRNIRRGHASCRVEIVEPPSLGADEWVRLYRILVERHDIRGRAAFPAAALQTQLEVPGTTLFRARVDGETVGMLVFMQDGDRAYYHLGAFSALGYRSRASYALFDVALQHLSSSARMVLLGAGAGDQDPGDDGLVRFKRGWGTVERVAWLGGRVLDPDRYTRLAARAHGADPAYFPIYRFPARLLGDRPSGSA